MFNKLRAGPVTIAAAAALLFSAALPVNSSAAGRLSGIVAYASGDVKIRHAGETEYSPANLDDLIYTGDSMETGPQSGASIALRFGSEVRVEENSVLHILPGKNMADVLELNMGQVWTRLLHKNARLEIGTPSAICAIRGTEADIEQRARLTVKVYEGHVDLSNSAGRQSLSAGQMSMVFGPGSAPTPTVQMKTADFGAWQEKMKVPDIHRYLDKLDAARKGRNLNLRINKDGKMRDVGIKVKKR